MKCLSLVRTGFWIIIIIGCCNSLTDGLTCYACDNSQGQESYKCLDPKEYNVHTELCAPPLNACMYVKGHAEFDVGDKHTEMNIVNRKCWTYTIPTDATNGSVCIPTPPPPLAPLRAGETYDDKVLNETEKVLQSLNDAKQTKSLTARTCFCNSGDNCNDEIHPSATKPTNATVLPVSSTIPAPGSASKILPTCFLTNFISLATVSAVLPKGFPLKM